MVCNTISLCIFTNNTKSFNLLTSILFNLEVVHDLKIDFQNKTKSLWLVPIRKATTFQLRLNNYLTIANRNKITLQAEIKNTRIKCYKCMRPSSTCICEHINPLQTKTRFIFLMHPKEYKKEKNGTGHMSNLQLENSEIIVGVDFTNNNRVNEILTKENSCSFLLYPGKDNFNLSTRKSNEIKSFMGAHPHIFILDGTWPCARKMLKLSTNLQKLKRVSFDNKIKSKFIIKQQPESLCLSTIESVYTVINLLKEGSLEQCETKDFLIPFEKMIEHQLEYILNPNSKNYCGTTKKEITPKNMYKKNTERNIIFEQENV